MKSDSSTFFKFIFTGFINTAFGYGTFVFLIKLGCSVWLAVIGSTILGVCFNFLTYGSYVFGYKNYRSLIRFIVFYVLITTLNILALKILISHHINSLVAQAIILPVMAILGFFCLKKFVYCPHNAS